MWETEPAFSTPVMLGNNSLSYHSRITRQENFRSYWVHYNPNTREFKAGQGTTKDLNHPRIIEHSSKEDADSTHTALAALGDDYTDFVSLEVIEKTSVELKYLFA